MKKITKFFLYILFFYLIYTPNLGVFIDVEFFLSKYIVIPIMLFFFCSLWIIKNKNIIVNKKTALLFIGIITSEIFFIIRAYIAGYDSFTELRIVQNMFVIFHIMTFLFLFRILYEKGYSTHDLINLIFNVALIQAIICILMYIFPELKNLANKLYFEAVKNINNNIKYIITIRIYGISEEYTFLTQIYHGFLASFALILGILKEKKYNIYIPFFLIASVLNGRTSIIIFLVSAFIIIMLLLFNKKYYKKAVKYTIYISAICIILLIIMLIFMPKTLDFIYNGLNQVIQYIINDQKLGNMKILIDDMTFWPEGLNFIFGEGHRVYGLQDNQHSDIGYVNDMFMGGLIYIFILYGSIIIFLFSENKTKDKKQNLINALFNIISIITLLLSNYKGECMKGGILLVMILTLKIVLNTQSYEERKSINE